MNKTAQRRGLLSRMREKVDIGGHAAEMFSPTFAGIMENLNSADDSVRELLLESNLKDLVKAARSNFNRREYILSISKLKDFHSVLDKVYMILNGFRVDVSKAHEEFIFQDLDDETKQSLLGLKSKFDATASASNNMLIKEAGISDWWYALTNDRGQALKAWEKRYPAQMKRLKSQTDSLISKSEQLFNLLLKELKEMSWARAKRKVEDYLKSAEKFLKKYEEYNKQFKQYYVDNIKNFVEKLQIETSKQVVTKGEEGAQQVVLPSEPSKTQIPQIDLPKTEPAKTEMTPEQASQEVLNKLEQVHGPAAETAEERRQKAELRKELEYAAQKKKEELAAEVEKNTNIAAQEALKKLEKQQDPVTLPPPKAAHQKFLHTLEVLANEHPMILAREIYKYAKAIENTDKQTSLKLLAIVEGITG